MASTRTIVVGKASLKWYTGSIRSLYWDHERIAKMYREVVKPALYGKLTSHKDIRRTVDKLVEKAILDGKVSTMSDWVNIVMALRLTDIDEEKMEDGGFKVRMVIPCFESQEKKTFWNIAWHMNHHCKQLWRCCFVQVTGSYESLFGSVALCWTHGEGYDRKGYFLDNYYEKDREEKWRYRK